MKINSISKIISNIRKTYFCQSKWFSTLLYLYIALFIFTMINREFLLFGLDLRFIELPLGLIILGVNFFSKKHRPARKKNDTIGRAMIAFYIYTFVSNIAWLWSGLEPDRVKLINELLLLSNVFTSLLVFYNNYKRLDANFILVSTIISCIILSVSILLIHQGLTLAQISGSPDAYYISRTTTNTNNNNLFGESFRCAGYASDPNYATILLLIGIVCTIKTRWRKSYRSAFIILFCLCMGLSFSRTILLAVLFCGGYVLFTSYRKLTTITKIRINRLIICGVITLAFIISLLPIIMPSLPLTLALRVKMWNGANQIFWYNPIFGSGITSFRSGLLQIHHWYVQAHSTYWQILAELGGIGIILYYRVIIKTLNNSIKTPINYFLVLIFIIWAFTYETIAFPFCIFIYYIVGNEVLDKPNHQTSKTALFFVNSLKQGGAEKVCLNLADELEREGYESNFVILKHANSSSKQATYNLRCNSKNKFLRTFQLLIAIFKINDYTTAQIIDNGDYSLITSHLPVSNILTRLSCINHQAIYVLHLTMNAYKFGPKSLYRKLVEFFFKNRKVVAVSDGLRQELIKEYHLSAKDVKIIYNPINPIGAEGEKEKQRPFDKPYFLHVGRFEEQKRQDRMLQIFKEGNFSKKYYLIFCGDGSTLKTIKAQAKKLKISHKVRFMGYQDNIYSWMRNAEIVIGTSDMESFHMNLIEALICGTKVVAADCDYGPREILINDYSSFLVSPNDDIQQYIDKINLALKSYPSSKNPIFEKVQPKNVVKKYLAFYRKDS